MINATPGDPAANSYLTVDEADGYWGARPFPDTWDNTEQSKEALLITATRLTDALFYPAKKLVREGKSGPYYVIRPIWLGSPASTTQALAWPRNGMVTIAGAPIPNTVIPDGLKAAVAELAGQLSKSDRLLDSDTVAQGISSISAGGVRIQFKETGLDVIKVLPDIMYELLVPWITDETIEQAYQLVFQVN
jgi:hypothetical protein